MQPYSVLELYAALSALGGMLTALALVKFVPAVRQFCAKPGAQFALFLLFVACFFAAGIATSVAFKLFAIGMFFCTFIVGIRTGKRNVN